ncbi:putative CAAX amino terminal protease protein [Mycoplasma haemocanis str. Illinois]|uniref:Putative CAAX amino terminal protease protein n=1 Tax=Mycoplasma haemocanis (strain Illinois) TaxID=1111676 RepID=H6N5Y7_MYCHN|nr:CPBP family intramembrane glutamic endopeptidase [Mycoplasma haemocanis]AEW44902.1 putative CAAX amino terminal protease protein [Mycoplasma haemocanis str. Illinois]
MQLVDRTRLWIENTREKYSAFEKPTSIRERDFFLLIIGCLSKEIIEFIIACFVGKNSQGISKLFTFHPLTDDLFWIIALKVVLGGATLAYFYFQYSHLFDIWYPLIFWLFVVKRSLVVEFQGFGGLWKNFAHLFGLFEIVITLIFFFHIDPTTIHSIKRIIYDHREFENIGGNYFLRENSEISWKKVRSFLINVACLTIWFFIAWALVHALIMSLIGSSSREKSRNQESLETHIEQGGIRIFELFIMTVFIAPIMEEAIFRKYVMISGGMTKKTILISAFLFGLVHLRNEGAITVLGYFIPGLMFATVYWTSGNIWSSILMHSIWNAFAFTAILFK